MCNLINTHTHTHTHWENQCKWHRVTKMTGPDCAVMCNLINTHTHTHTHTHTQHTHTHTHTHTQQVSLIPPWEDQCELHRMTRMTGPDCAVMCNLINTHTGTSTRHYHRQPLRRFQSEGCSTPCRKTPRRRSRAEEKQVSVLVPRYLLPPSSRYVDMW